MTVRVEVAEMHVTDAGRFGGLEHSKRSHAACFMGSFVSTPLQEGQTKMSFSLRVPSFEMVRRCFIVSPQVKHTMVRVLSGTGGGRSITGIVGV
jgi:hypothetical protein